MKTLSTILSLSTGAALIFGACSGADIRSETAAPDAVETAMLSPLDAAISAPSRGENAARDNFRNPHATLTFFELGANMTVVEIWPGGGWYSDILVPYAAATNGNYIAGGFPNTSERGRNGNAQFAEKYGDKATLVPFGKDSAPLAASGSVDRVLSFRNVHNWMGAEFADQAFDTFYAALKPGGILGVVEHRLPATGEQDPRATSGYVQEAYVIKLAEDAGFELVGRSEINANPKDTADHPLGVWTLPPVSRREARDGSATVEDGSKYEAIGESDRMTLKFRKPG